MAYLEDLNLTPSQLHELEDADPDLIEQWLQALDTKKGLKSPAGWFYAGVRSGKSPGYSNDPSKAKAIDLAERYIRNAGMFNPDQASLLDDLFGQHGTLKAWHADEQLRERMAALWRSLQPAAELVQSEAEARGNRHRKARMLARVAAAPADDEEPGQQPKP